VKKRMVAYLALLVLAAGCGQEIEPGRTTDEAPVVHGLGLQKVQPATLPRGESFVGTVESPDRGVLRARIDGQVAEMPIREGERVKSGQLLLVLADHQAADRLKEAREAAAAAESSLSAARAGSRLAQKTHERYARLMTNQAVTPQEMDEVEARLERARQQVKSAEAGLARSRRAAIPSDRRTCLLAATDVFDNRYSVARLRSGHEADDVSGRLPVGRPALSGSGGPDHHRRAVVHLR